jgi:DNA modification methylase
VNKYLNKITCGDCYELIKDLPDKSIDCIYTDIPYLYDHGGSGSSDVAKRINRQHNETLVEIRDGIDYSLLEEFMRVMKKVNCFIWCSKKQIYDIIKFFVEYENKEIHFEILTWNKTNPTPATNNVWLPDIEYCLYFREKGITLNDGYEHKSKWYTSSINKSDKDIFEHPTIKPLALVKRHLLHATQPNDIVLDCFMGSGTTAIACKEIGRQFIGFEISEKWCKIANDRLNNIDANGQISLFAR